MKAFVSFNSFTLFLIIVFVFCSCKNDDIVDEKPEETLENNPADFALNLNRYKGESISIETILVKVVDELGTPLNDVNVFAGGFTNQTDKKGVAIFNNVSAFKNFLTAKLSKLGYISTVKTIIPSGSRPLIFEVVLLKPDVETQVSSGQEASVSTPSGAKVVLNGNYFNPDGSSYTGVVNVGLKHLSPENETTYSNMPGNLLAQDTKGQVKLLETYGMLAVELTGASGEQLNINTENKATISLPIALNQQVFSADSIPLWYFDEDKGIWVEEGNAIKESNNYVGEVSHFSWWNCDVPINLVNLCLSVQNSDGNVLPNQPIKIVRDETNQIVYNGFTDSDGKLCGAIPKNEKVTVTVFGDLNCLGNNIVDEKTLGEYNNEENYENVNIDENSNSFINFKITGNVSNCDAIQIVNGFVEVKHRGKTHITFIDNNGDFNYNLLGCDGDEVILIGYDVLNKMSTDPKRLNFTDNKATINDLKTCNGYTESTYVGDINIRTQEELDDFSRLGYNIIDGNLQLNTIDLVDLIGLESITEVKGSVFIASENTLKSLVGLENLTLIEGDLMIIQNGIEDLKGLNGLSFVKGDIYIGDNDLITYEGLENLMSVGGNFTINYNYALTNLLALGNLNSVGRDLKITTNRLLTNLSGLENLNSVGSGLIIGDMETENKSLISLKGLDNLTTVQHIEISNNPALINLNGLSKVSSLIGGLYINNNNSLTSLDGLNNLQTIGEAIRVQNNNVLTDFCALSNMSIINGGYEVSDNAYNPTVTQIASQSECSQ